MIIVYKFHRFSILFNYQFSCTDVDVREIERLKSKRAELDDRISTLGRDIQAFQSELRHVEDKGANLHRDRVSETYVYRPLWMSILLIRLLLQCLFYC